MAIESIDLDKCIGCGTCVASCPMDVIRMDKVTKKAKVVYAKDCQMCNQCANYCPVGNLHTITPEKCTRPMVGWG